MPEPRKRKFEFTTFLRKVGLDSLKPLILTHRGYGKRAEIPENTMEAFEAATKLGFQGHELDVRLTKDKVVVIFHGPELARTTEGTGVVEKKTFDEISKLNAAHYLGVEGKFTPVPTLEEYIQKIGLNTFTDIELKKEWHITSYDLEDKVVELVHKYGLEKKVILTSFNVNVIRYIRKKYPHLLTGIITTKDPKSLFWIPIGIFWAKPDIVVLHRGLLTENWVRFVHLCRCGFATWGANREDDFKAYVEMGIDIIITDNMKFTGIEAVYSPAPEPVFVERRNVSTETTMDAVAEPAQKESAPLSACVRAAVEDQGSISVSAVDAQNLQAEMARQEKSIRDSGWTNPEKI